MNKKIIGFAGRKRSGKGLLSNAIVNERNGKTVILTIASYLKELCCDLLGIDINTMLEWKDNGHTFVKTPNDRWYNLISKRSGIERSIVEREISDITFTDVRQVLQVVGTDLIRKYVPDWHINNLLKDIESYSDEYTILVDDVRFENEKEMLSKIGAELFFIIRPNCFEISNHASETALRWQDFDDDHIIINNFPKDVMEQLFILAYKTDFTKNNGIPIFLSANPIYKTAYNTDFPSLHSSKRIIEDIISQNKDNLNFLKNGVIYFKAKNRQAASDFNDSLFNFANETYRRDFIIYNPLINENLKLHWK